MTHLTTPSSRYWRSYLSALREVTSTRVSTATRKAAHEQRPGTARAFWLVDGGKYVGMVQVRAKPSSGLDPRLKNHIYYEIRPSMRRRGYGTMALALALKKARRYGLKHVFVVCRKDNVGSRRIIEKNGGKLLKAVAVSGYRQSFLKYRIGTTAS